MNSPTPTPPATYCDEHQQPLSREEWIIDRLLITYAAMELPAPTAPVLVLKAQDLAAELSDEQLLRALTRLRKEAESVSVKAILELAGNEKMTNASEPMTREELEAARAEIAAARAEIAESRLAVEALHASVVRLAALVGESVQTMTRQFNCLTSIISDLNRDDDSR